MARVTYTESLCIGCGICASLASTIWQMNPATGKAIMVDAEGRGHTVTKPLWPDEADQVKMAAKACPMTAIGILK